MTGKSGTWKIYLQDLHMTDSLLGKKRRKIDEL